MSHVLPCNESKMFSRSLDGRSTVLIVNDVPDQLDLLEAVLRKAHYDVIRATDGREAFGLAQTTPPDLIISDVTMPRPYGIGLCRLARESTALRATPIFITECSTKGWTFFKSL